MTTDTDAARRDAVCAENQQLRQHVAELRAALQAMLNDPESDAANLIALALISRPTP